MVWSVIAQTVSASLRYRVTGLAAEAAFFAILSLPPLVFGLAGAVGFVAQRFAGDDASRNSAREVLDLSSRLLTPPVVEGVIAPTLDDVLSAGPVRDDLDRLRDRAMVGFPRLNVVIDTVTIMYGLAGQRSIVRTRALAFPSTWFCARFSGDCCPWCWPDRPWWIESCPERLDLLGNLYWPVVLVGTVCLLATQYHFAVPVRTRWRADLPGAVLTLLMWLGAAPYSGWCSAWRSAPPRSSARWRHPSRS